METNEQKASEIVIKIQNSSSLDYDGRRAKYMYDSAMEMAKWKEEQFKNQEQTLLWTVEHILDRLCIEGEAREIAIKEFTNDLQYYNEKEDDSKE